jgi:predicted MFS family arabinose efflux permease
MSDAVHFAGFSMSYGIFQDYYSNNWALNGSRSATGVIGTTSNGVTYIAMPFFFALFSKRWARYRLPAAACGTILSAASFALSSFSQDVWHLVLTQGILAAIGSALVYSPTTLSLGEWFNGPNGICNRAVAFGLCLSAKNIVGTTCPFLCRALLDGLGFRNTMRVWGGITLTTGLLAVALIPPPPSAMSNTRRSTKIPWTFLTHPTFYIYSTATLLQSAGYGIPQTYLSEYGRDIVGVSSTYATLLITLINFPGILASFFFGYLCDNRRLQLSMSTVTALSALTSSLAAFVFWGLAGGSGSGSGSLALLVLFAITFGFSASGYSATWAGTMNDMEREAANRNEAIDTGFVYGLMNGARGLGYVGGGLVGVPLLEAGSSGTAMGKLGYSTTYGPLILFTGSTLACGGLSLLWRGIRSCRACVASLS